MPFAGTVPLPLTTDGCMCRGRDAPAGTPGRSAARDPCSRELGKRVAGLTLVGVLLIAGGQGVAGHQVGHYPSYYPDEIRIDVIDPAAAAKGLSDETLHAYVGAAPAFTGPPPEHVKSVKSLGFVSRPVVQHDLAALRFRRGSLRRRRGCPGRSQQEDGGQFRFPSLSGDTLSRRLPAPLGSA